MLESQNVFRNNEISQQQSSQIESQNVRLTFNKHGNHNDNNNNSVNNNNSNAENPNLDELNIKRKIKKKEGLYHTFDPSIKKFICEVCTKSYKQRHRYRSFFF